MIQCHENRVANYRQGDEQLHKWVEYYEGDDLGFLYIFFLNDFFGCHGNGEFKKTTFLNNDHGNPQSQTQKMSMHRKQPSMIFCFKSSLKGTRSGGTRSEGTSLRRGTWEACSIISFSTSTSGNLFIWLVGMVTRN